MVLPSPDYFTVAVRFCPLLFELRKSKNGSVIPLPYRMIFAIATKCSVYLYDTQQKLPFGLISNIHYTRLTDLAWSNDGNTLLVSSTDGYCSIIQFSDGELGLPYTEKTINEIVMSKMSMDEPKKKKKAKKPKKEDGKEKSPSLEAKENCKVNIEEDNMLIGDISINNLPESIKEMIPVDNIIKSTEIFSPEKRDGTPATPIQVRKFPRTIEEVSSVDIDPKNTPPRDDNLKLSDVSTPKSLNFKHHLTSKTPTPIEVRRHPRVLQPKSTGKANDGDEKINDGDDWPKEIPASPMNRKIPPAAVQSTTPKTPRRIEPKTISTPKSKKKLLS